MRKATILLAEDSTDTRELLHYLLEGEGFEVIEAADGAIALQSLSQTRPDLILTDLTMPQMDGVELIRRVREQEKFVDLPIVAMSACHSDHLKRASIAGATATICKPLEAGDLFDMLNHLLPHQAKTWQ